MNIAALKKEIPILYRLAWPMIVGQIGQMLFGLIDVLMVGRVGTIDLAAVSFANSVYVVFLVFGIGVSNATSPLMARSLGQKNLAAASRIMTNAVRVNLVLALFLTVGCLLTVFGFDRMGQVPEVAQKAKQFFIIISFTFVPALMYQCLKQVLESLNHPKVPMNAMFVGLGLNVVLNAMFIFGFQGIPAMGAAGAAIGTLISRTVMTLILMFFIWRDRRLSEFRKHRHPRERVHKHVIRDLLALGVPGGFGLLFEVGAFAAAALMMGWIGSVELAGHQVAISLASLSFMVPLGLSFAAGMRVGFEAGRNDYAAVRVSGMAGILCATIFMAGVAVIFALGNNFFPSLFTEDPAVRKLAGQLMIVVALFQLSDGVQVVCVGLLRSLRDIRWPFFITFAAYWLLALPGGYLLTFHFGFGPLGIWYGLFGGLLFAAIALSLRFLKIVGKHAPTLPEN